MVDLRIDLPEHFLEEEIRCGYSVSREMKEVWAVELDLLAKLDTVCKKHDIIYFASGGTMLGAIRHNGFIPWDDDIDVMMMRDQYEKLCRVAPEEFEYPFFFQTEYTDQGSLKGHAKLRNSETTGIQKSDYYRNLKINQGIFLDIFPLDNVTNDELAFEQQGRKAIRWKKIARVLGRMTYKGMAHSPNRYKYYCRKIMATLFSPIFAKLSRIAYKRFETVCQQYNRVETDRISTLSFQFYNLQHIKYAADYESLIDVPFEFLTIPVGANYSHALQTRYGNWKEIVKDGSCHGEMIFDASKSYRDYIS